MTACLFTSVKTMNAMKAAIRFSFRGGAASAETLSLIYIRMVALYSVDKYILVTRAGIRADTNLDSINNLEAVKIYK